MYSKLQLRPQPKPSWLKVRAPGGEKFKWLKQVTAEHKLSTVCEEAKCPNIGECWAGGTATFMLLGSICTRGCKFCAVSTGNPRMQLDPHEPEKIASLVADMKLNYIVLTSVDRDDLPDQGVRHFARTVMLSKLASPQLLVEVLTPDWRGNQECVRVMAEESTADVLAHNVETVERLQTKVRDPRAGYSQSLEVLKQYRIKAEASGRKVLTKSSLMLGVGESDEEILRTMKDIYSAGVTILTLGQYLQPTPRHLKVERFVSPEMFSEWARIGEDMGFSYVASGPLVRSSYKAGEYYIDKILRGNRSRP